MMLTRAFRQRALAPLVSGLVLVLAGCSSNEIIEQPDPVPDIDESVELDRVWHTSVGDGHDDEFPNTHSCLNQSCLGAVKCYCNISTNHFVLNFSRDGIHPRWYIH